MCLTLLHSEKLKLHTMLAFLSVIGLKNFYLYQADHSLKVNKT